MLKFVFLATVGVSLAANVTKAIACPMFRCLDPVCPAGQVVTPQTSPNGCYACPLCKPCPILNCPMIACPVDQQTPGPKLANGCSGCPTCPTGGGSGSGSVCSHCGDSCTTAKGTAGFCSVNNKCIKGTVKPMCVNPVCLFVCPALTCPADQQVPAPSTQTCGCPTCKTQPPSPKFPICPMIACPKLECPVAQQVKPNNPNGCGCPTCGSQPPTPKFPICPTYACPMLACPLTQQVKPNNPNGCGCPTCGPIVATPVSASSTTKKGNNANSP